MDTFDIVRINTLHPALVHLPLGIIPLCLLAYFVAASMGAARGGRWVFVGDVALASAVVVTTLSAAAGYLAYFRLQWPGALDPWPLVHLVLGTSTTVGIWLIAGFRYRALKRSSSEARVSSARAQRWSLPLSMTGITVAALATGYIGGEVLVFHGGMAVKAGAQGMLAPPLRVDHRSPDSLHDAMHKMRGLWASSVAVSTRALTETPAAEHFRQIADDAEGLQKLTRWVIDWAHQPKPDAQHHADLDRLAQEMEDQALKLEQAATQADLPATLDALGKVSAACASCHVQARWHNSQAISMSE